MAMAPLTRPQKKALAAALPSAVIDPASPPPVIDPADSISKLPKEIQEHILSFLPAQQAVQTCILARTWRHVWKSTTRLLITAESVHEARHFETLRELSASGLVDRLLRVRLDGLKAAPLDAVEIRFDPEYYLVNFADYLDSEGMSSVNKWIRLVLKCQIQMFRLDMSRYNEAFMLVENRLLVSQHLTRLEFTRVEFGRRCLNLDGCPALEHLEIHQCWMEGVRKMTSLSLKRLVIRSCYSMRNQKRIQICVPRLVSLSLELNNVRTPILEKMPELVGAKVCINSYDDKCDCDDLMACHHVTRAGNTSYIDSKSDDDEEGSGDYPVHNTTKCVVLEGLAQARDLVLTADSTYIFRRDLMWCPTFSNLKTLVFIEEYQREPADCSVLKCMLEHAPVLEKVTLNLKKEPRDGKYKVEIKGYPDDAKVTSTKISQHLQIVKIICEGVDGIFVNVLNLLDTLNICFETRVTKYMP